MDPLRKTRACRDTGNLYRFRSVGEPSLPCALFMPDASRPPRRLLVSVHGISRNAEEHLQEALPLAAACGVALLVPRFSAFDFPDYQRLGRRGHGPRADLALLRALDEVADLFAWELPRIDLFGYSGGAQFAHRFALVHPRRIRRLGLGAAGWYSWPDRGLRYPLGVGRTPALDAPLCLKRLLRKRIRVYVGAQDRRRDPALNTREAIDRLQGLNRLQRARNWVAAMRAAAESAGLKPRIRLRVLPDASHDFGDMVHRGGLLNRLFEDFYGCTGGPYR